MHITTTDGANVSQGNSSNLEKGSSPAEKSAVINKINMLERQLFDDERRLRRGVTEERAIELLAEINALRRRLGWLSLDLKHRLVWPEDLLE